ncbi:hypothetical protein D3C78_1703950 [compost metagenome]
MLVLKRPELPAVEREFGSGEALLAGLWSRVAGWPEWHDPPRRVENDRRSFPPAVEGYGLVENAARFSTQRALTASFHCETQAAAIDHKWPLKSVKNSR